MYKLLFLTAIAAAIGAPSIATAQTTSALVSDICRPIAAGETANATIQNAKFLCKPVNMERIHKAMIDAQAGLSPDQKAKADYAMQVLQDELELHPQYPGYNGNPNN